GNWTLLSTTTSEPTLSLSTRTAPSGTSPRPHPEPGRPRSTCQDASVAYDEGLATRLRQLIGGGAGVAGKKRVGGPARLRDGNMAIGVHGDELIVRTEPGQQEQLLAEPGARVFDLTGRPMKGWLLVEADGCAEDADLRRWVDRGIAFARSLPAK